MAANTPPANATIAATRTPEMTGCSIIFAIHPQNDGFLPCLDLDFPAADFPTVCSLCIYTLLNQEQGSPYGCGSAAVPGVSRKWSLTQPS